MGKLFRIALITIVILTLNPYAKAQPILNELPAGAQAIILVKPLDSLNTKINAFATAISMPQESMPRLQDLLAMQISMPGLIDGARPIALAIDNLKDPKGTLVAFLPIVDRDSVISTLPQAGFTKTDEPDIYQLRQGEMYITIKGQYIVAADTIETLKDFPTQPKGIKLAPKDAAIFKKCDIAATVKLSSVMPEFIKKAKLEIDQDPKVAEQPLLAELAKLALDRVAEIETATLGILLSDPGISINLAIHTKQGSLLAKALSNHPKTDISELKGLPDGSFTTAYAVSMDGNAFKPMINAITDIIAADEKTKEKINTVDIEQLRKLLLQACEPVAGASADYVFMEQPSDTSNTATATIKQKTMGIVKSINADKTRALYAKTCPIIAKVLTQAGLTVDIQYTKAAGDIDGTIYDELTVDLSQLDIPQEALERIKSQLGGKAAITQQIAKIDNKKLAFATGTSVLKELITSLNANTQGLAANQKIADTARNLPPKANMLTFVNIANAAQAALANAPMEAMMILGPLAQLQGTLGIAATMDKGSLDIELLVPTETVQSVAALVTQMLPMFMGGGMGGPGMGGPGGPG